MPIEEEQTIDLVSSPENIPPVMAENLTISTTSENFAKKRTRKAKKPENQKVINGIINYDKLILRGRMCEVSQDYLKPLSIGENLSMDNFAIQYGKLQKNGKFTDQTRNFSRVYQIVSKNLGMVVFELHINPHGKIATNMESNSFHFRFENELFYILGFQRISKLIAEFSDDLATYSEGFGLNFEGIVNADICFDTCDKTFFEYTQENFISNSIYNKALVNSFSGNYDNLIDYKAKYKTYYVLPKVKGRLNRMVRTYNKSDEISEQSGKEYISIWHKDNGLENNVIRTEIEMKSEYFSQGHFDQLLDEKGNFDYKQVFTEMFITSLFEKAFTKRFQYDNLLFKYENTNYQGITMKRIKMDSNTVIKSDKRTMKQLEELVYNEDAFNRYDMTINEIEAILSVLTKVQNAVREDAGNGNDLAVDILTNYEVKRKEQLNSYKNKINFEEVHGFEFAEMSILDKEIAKKSFDIVNPIFYN